MKAIENTITYSRRSLLMILGSGVISLISLLTGCDRALRTYQEREYTPIGRMKPLQAQKKINRMLVEEARKRWKKVFQALKYKEGQEIITKKIKDARNATIALLDHLDDIGFNAEIDARLDSLELQDGQEQVIRSLIAGGREMEMPDSVLSEFYTVWLKEDKRVAAQYIKRHGGVSAHLRRLLNDLYTSDFLEQSAKQGHNHMLSSGEFSYHLEGCRETAKYCAALFTVAVAICAIEGDYCDEATIAAAGLCALYGALHGCRI